MSTVKLYTDVNYNSRYKYYSDAGKSDCLSKSEFFFKKWGNLWKMKELFFLVAVSKFGDCIVILPFRSNMWY